MVDVEPWIPTLEMARRAEASFRVRALFRRSVDLLDREPSRTVRLAAIVLWAHEAERPEDELLRYTYVPSMPTALELGAARILDGPEARVLPEALRISMELDRSPDPYRSAPRAVPTDFHGFHYRDVSAQVASRIRALRRAHPDASVHTFAWPILRLTFRTLFRRREVALLLRPDGVLQGLLSKGALF